MKRCGSELCGTTAHCLCLHQTSLTSCSGPHMPGRDDPQWQQPPRSTVTRQFYAKILRSSQILRPWLFLADPATNCTLRGVTVAEFHFFVFHSFLCLRSRGSCAPRGCFPRHENEMGEMSKHDDDRARRESSCPPAPTHPQTVPGLVLEMTAQIGRQPLALVTQ